MKTYTAIGTMRRLRGLGVMGWPLEAVAERTGLPMVALRAAQDGTLPVYGDDIDARVAVVYRRLVAIPGPDAALASTCRGLGWASPLAWDDPDTDVKAEKNIRWSGASVVDPFAIEVALRTRDGRLLNRAERVEAARRLGMPSSPNSVISTKLGLSTSVAASLRRELMRPVPVPAA